MGLLTRASKNNVIKIDDVMDTFDSKEDKANKKTTLTNSDTDYPTTKAVKTAVDLKEDKITAGTTSQYWRGDKTWQTFPNVDLSGYMPKTGGTFTGEVIFNENVTVKKNLSFLKPTGTGTQVASISGNTGQSVSLKQGFYRLVATGAGGGGGGTSSWADAYAGSKGGKIEIVFFVLENTTAYLVSGGGGGAGEGIGNQSGGPGAGGGGAGSGLIIPSLGVFMLACGGQGGNVSAQGNATGGVGGLCNGARGDSIRGAGGGGGTCSGSTGYGTFFGFSTGSTVSLPTTPKYGGIGQGGGIITTTSGIGTVTAGGGAAGGGVGMAGSNGSAILYRLST